MKQVPSQQHHPILQPAPLRSAMRLALASARGHAPATLAVCALGLLSVAAPMAQAGGSMLPTFVEQVVSTNADGARSVSSVDVDGDGDIDLLSASANDNKIA